MTENGESAIKVPKWTLAVAVPLTAAVIGAIAADVRAQDAIRQASKDVEEIREELRAHKADDAARHQASTEQRFKMSQQIQWLCVMRAADEARSGKDSQCP